MRGLLATPEREHFLTLPHRNFREEQERQSAAITTRTMAQTEQPRSSDVTFCCEFARCEVYSASRPTLYTVDPGVFR